MRKIYNIPDLILYNFIKLILFLVLWIQRHHLIRIIRIFKKQTLQEISDFYGKRIRQKIQWSELENLLVENFLWRNLNFIKIQ